MLNPIQPCPREALAPGGAPTCGRWTSPTAASSRTRPRSTSRGPRASRACASRTAGRSVAFWTDPPLLGSFRRLARGSFPRLVQNVDFCDTTITQAKFKALSEIYIKKPKSFDPSVIFQDCCRMLKSFSEMLSFHTHSSYFRIPFSERNTIKICVRTTTEPDLAKCYRLVTVTLQTRLKRTSAKNVVAILASGSRSLREREPALCLAPCPR